MVTNRDLGDSLGCGKAVIVVSAGCCPTVGFLTVTNSLTGQAAIDRRAARQNTDRAVTGFPREKTEKKVIPKLPERCVADPLARASGSHHKVRRDQAEKGQTPPAEWSQTTDGKAYPRMESVQGPREEGPGEEPGTDPAHPPDTRGTDPRQDPAGTDPAQSSEVRGTGDRPRMQSGIRGYALPSVGSISLGTDPARPPDTRGTDPRQDPPGTDPVQSSEVRGTGDRPRAGKT